MRQLIELQRQLVPELLDVMRKRYRILQQVMLAGTIGRRALATTLSMTERVLRAETELLKEQGLLIIQSSGMQLSEDGKKTLEEIEQLGDFVFGSSEIEEKLKSMYGLKQVIVVPGDSEQSEIAKKELGRATGLLLKQAIRSGDVIAVSGGTTTAQVAKYMSLPNTIKDVVFVPARGGLGESLDYQANTIVSMMAKRTGGHYRLLHVPDHISSDAYESMIQEPSIKEIVQVIRNARIIVHGIGDAIVMARRRKTDPEELQAMLDEGAMAESFGFYFNRSGELIHKMKTVGMRLEDIAKTEVLIAVAGGASKAEAIDSIMKFGYDHALVTDEGAALRIIEMYEANGHHGEV
ncbi:sugar-binding transcriptional regulator [Paenibacillus endoradicis]|uniref:sugar-binding transcriptional regulator n=1 Tax=Paenibacillus endoradicis TaxID=2972487 RepID=UPI002159014F|nr:sugar-binding domain-containing protein [Paenibacillus endoradicis]MCR8659729.1 sugar-binding domain-containing protein [Paenibacillus endoradicis]